MKRTILITGGAGFIGSHVVRLFVNKYPDYRIVNLDKLTYAGNLANLRDIEDSPNYVFEKGDICDLDMLRALFGQYDIDGVIHLAAESHVDRSIRDPFTFARTNVLGTLSLLEAAREYWNGEWEGKLFYHISTDEVYGDLALDDPALEDMIDYSAAPMLYGELSLQESGRELYELLLRVANGEETKAEKLGDYSWTTPHGTSYNGDY